MSETVPVDKATVPVDITSRCACEPDFSDSVFKIHQNGDPERKLAFNLSSVGGSSTITTLRFSRKVI